MQHPVGVVMSIEDLKDPCVDTGRYTGQGETSDKI